MGSVLERGGSNLGWYRLNHGPNGLGVAPPTGGNCRESFGIVRNYDNPGVRSATQDLLDQFRDAGQCWIRTDTYYWMGNGGGTLIDVRNGQVPTADLNRMVNWLTDIHDRGFKLNFSHFYIGELSPQNWNTFEQGLYNIILSVILQLQPIVDSFGWPDYHTDLGNEMQAASNQSAAMRQFGWQIYRDFVAVHGNARTGGVSVGMGAGPPGLSRYNIQFQDQQDPNKGLHGVAPILDVHGYAPFSNASTNWLKLLENEMIQNGDNRNIRISETFDSVHTQHVSQFLAQVAQLDRDIEHVIQWPLTQFGNCSDVDHVDTVDFTYGGNPCSQMNDGISCPQSEWAA